MTYAPPAFRYDPSIHYRNLLHKLGYSTDSCSIHDLKPGRIRKYNLVVLMELSYGMTAEQYGPLLCRLEGYLQEGGSLLLYAHAWWKQAAPDVRASTTPCGNGEARSLMNRLWIRLRSISLPPVSPKPLTIEPAMSPTAR